MTGHDIIILIVAIIGSGGLISGVVAWIKVRPEAGQILVTTAQGVVIVQTSVIDSLQKEINRISHELEEVRTELVESRNREEKLKLRIRELEHMQAGSI